MSDIFEGVEPMVHQSRISVPYNWSVGETGTHFFRTLRDKQKITATKCSKCKGVFIPPRKTCPTCFIDNDKWVDVGPEGKLVSFTVVRRQFASLKKNVPVVFALVKLDGADTAMLHMIGEIKPEDVKIGMRVCPRFADERKGTIMDIEYFKPVN